MPQCPKCRSTDLRRSQTRNRWERWRKEITGKRPYRCRSCQWRSWKTMNLGDDAPKAAMRPNVPEPPNLRGTAFARDDARPQVDLKELDRFDARPPGAKGGN